MVGIILSIPNTIDKKFRDFFLNDIENTAVHCFERSTDSEVDLNVKKTEEDIDQRRIAENHRQPGQSSQ